MSNLIFLSNGDLKALLIDTVSQKISLCNTPIEIIQKVGLPQILYFEIFDEDTLEPDSEKIKQIKNKKIQILWNYGLGLTPVSKI